MTSSGQKPQLQNHAGPQQGDVAACVQALLTSTRELQAALARWARGALSETEVSDVYVRIGTDFNGVVFAFAHHGIDVSEIHAVPGELRAVLEQCLGEDPSEEVLARYTPEVRRVLVRLLLGLRAKREAWWAVRGDGRRMSDGSRS